MTAAPPIFIEQRIRIDSDSTIVALSGKVDYGQGIRTAFAQIVAEELAPKTARNIFGTMTKMCKDGATSKVAALPLSQIFFADSLGITPISASSVTAERMLARLSTSPSAQAVPENSAIPRPATATPSACSMFIVGFPRLSGPPRPVRRRLYAEGSLRPFFRR